ncbi:IS66 family insertion sequence element accessory protein TnpB [Shewanella sp. 202IG2-18]|uniref:IS66 family insertion sequence element accessory protein TnpB n=1 Tax=Parashewanella hymeniacidonis TaxID=2807618 RepID=UPI00196205DA|nr:IS66 family insertion sequence element accessory protein TnpB [Parashewanella hymeniacidonis]MBM7074280.1 IS66 family insertion sequence element accessory protein TnpB [Parashewanella hymeniacidonis]
MIMFQAPPKVYLYRDFIDFRKSINGLSIIVEQQMELRSTDGSVFVFCNKGRDKLKIFSMHKQHKAKLSLEK